MDPKAESDDPRRCQCVTPKGQCPSLACEGKAFCRVHGGSKVDKSLRNYHLNKWSTRVNELADNELLKNINEEIGILRMMLETRLNRIHDEAALIIDAGPITNLVDKIASLVERCHKLELNTGKLLNKQSIMQFADEVIAIISDVVENETQLAVISERIVAALEEQ